MFDFEIDKFKRKMNLRIARYKKDLARDYPELCIEETVDVSEGHIIDTELFVKLKSPEVEFQSIPTIENEIYFTLRASELKNIMKHIEVLYMFDNNYNKSSEQIDLMWSYLFKTTCPETDVVTGNEIPKEDLLIKCLKEIDRRCEGGITKMYTEYEIRNNYTISRNDFVNAAFKYRFETAGILTTSVLESAPNVIKSIAIEIATKKLSGII